MRISDWSSDVCSSDLALPPDPDLAEAYKVSRVTVRKALDGLVDARLLTRRQGAGTFVAARVEQNFATISSFTEDMLSRGRAPRSEWMSRSEGRSGEHTSELKSILRNSDAVFCLIKKKYTQTSWY